MLLELSLADCGGLWAADEAPELSPYTEVLVSVTTVLGPLTGSCVVRQISINLFHELQVSQCICTGTWLLPIRCTFSIQSTQPKCKVRHILHETVLRICTGAMRRSYACWSCSCGRSKGSAQNQVSQVLSLTMEHDAYLCMGQTQTWPSSSISLSRSSSRSPDETNPGGNLRSLCVWLSAGSALCAGVSKDAPLLMRLETGAVPEYCAAIFGLCGGCA